ncbi:hypothetical protein AB0I66_35175 [Streptomyces sp. NPDC050439]|uniref:hypothetical protein n=1 Tax=unclassified Streptomyces TaxID=2593676 RepID=UPI00342DA9EF
MTPALHIDVTSLHPRAEPGLPSLRDPFEQHLGQLKGWVSDFCSFAGLVTEWGEVVTEAAGRGWGIIGLTC